MTTRVALTGGGGFLGWHVRAALRELGAEVTLIPVGDGFDPEAAVAAVDGADRVIHLAGINRAAPEEVREGNPRFAAQLAQAISAAKTPPRAVVFANSIQAGNGSDYGAAKAESAGTLAAAASTVGASFDDVLLPNLFGEHGRPDYNSVTATFCDRVASGGAPTVEQDRELELMHAQDAADLLLGDLAVARPDADLVTRITVSQLLDRVTSIAAVYRRGEIPDISTRFDLALFNTYRSYTFPREAEIAHVRHADPRGSFFELTKTHGGTGQSSFATSNPGVTRGDHYHRRKIERFTVISGSAVIALRRLFHDEIIEFAVESDRPVSIDMPTMWTHSITNTGPGELHLALWTNDLFDPSRPDTIMEPVR